MADQYICLTCLKAVTATKAGNYRKHTDQEGVECEESGGSVPPREIEAGPLAPDADLGVPQEGRDFAPCPGCGRNTPLGRDRTLNAHQADAPGGKIKCPRSETKYDGPGPRETSPSEAAEAAQAPAEEPSSSPESPSTHSDSSEPQTSESLSGSAESTESLPPKGTTAESGAFYAQPGSPFLQPGDIPPKVKNEMTDMGKEIAARLKEIFYSYDNRRSSDNRSAQTTLGPSEIGTPCDRRLAMELLKIEPTNPGGDGWAAFVGTCVHAGLDDMFQWANHGTGRYATEIPLTFPSAYVPKGTGDLLDRILLMFIDHKAMGAYSLKKLREKGPSETYRVQVQTYGLGATLLGEKVKHVAIIGWPRAGSSLDDLWVWTEPYDPSVAKDALKRVDRIAKQTIESKQRGVAPMDSARTFPIADKYECRFCPFHLKGDTEMHRGCPGA